MEELATDYEGWAIVQVMGHSAYAGRISGASIAGRGFVRVDVPEIDGQPAFTKFLGAASIFDITPTTEQAALHAAGDLRARPVSVVDLRPRIAGPAAPAPEDYDDGYAEY